MLTEDAYQAWRRDENTLLDRRVLAHEALEDALEELSRSWGWNDLSRQLTACEDALRDAKAALIAPEADTFTQLTLISVIRPSLGVEFSPMTDEQEEWLEALGRYLHHAERRFLRLEDQISLLEGVQMGTQGEVDAATQAIQKVSDDISNVRGVLQTEIDNIAAAHPGVDLSKLNAGVALLDPAVEALGALKPEAPPAPPAETTTPPAEATPAPPVETTPVSSEATSTVPGTTVEGGTPAA